MVPKKDGPYMLEPMGSILETVTILGQLLRPEGFPRNIITDMATSIFVHNEQQSIKDESSMHLVAIKKTLLYAIPIITTPDGTTGIPLTSQVATTAIQLYKDKPKQAKLAIGDKFRLLGFTFPPVLINHLAYSIFPQKYFTHLPSNYKNYTPSPIDLSFIKELETKTTKYGKLFIINKSEYENVSLFNQINKILANKLTEELTVVIKTGNELTPTKLPLIPRIKPYNTKPFIEKLNQILERQIDISYNIAFYEALQMTANWLLYDQIALLGFESAEVKNAMNYLGYVKEQNRKVSDNIREVNYKRLLNTRAETICRRKYPYYFDYTDRRSIFVRFNRFSIDKLPKQNQEEVQILLKKELEAQEALLRNKCEHIKYVKALSDNGSQETFKEVETYINYDTLDSDGMYSCKLCTYPLVCVHTVELYDAMRSIPEGVDNADNVYWAKQTIVNKFKATNKLRTGEEGTEESYTYYCKYCGGELGKTNDIIQASIKTTAESSSYNELDPIDVAIYNGISAVISNNMDTNVMILTKKAITKLIYEEIKDEVMVFIKRASKRDEDNIDILVRYITQIYTLVSLISININKIKATQSIIRGTGPALKDELVAALKIVKVVGAYKQIGITDDKIKTMLIEAFKYANRIFASDTIVLKANSPKDKLELDIKCSPLTRYAAFIHNRFEKTKVSELDVMGVKIDTLFPTKANKGHSIKSHALYIDMYDPSIKPSSDKVQYMIESYKSLVTLAKTEPTNGKFISVITPTPSEFITKYEKQVHEQLVQIRHTPIRHLPVENGREHDFNLSNYHIGYCFGDSVRPHRWTVAKDNNKLIYTCKYCKLNIEKANKNNNDKIEDMLDEQMIMEAFFELYTISCPVKDAHVFDNGTCSQCGVTKSEISNMDSKYYKKHSATYLKHRKSFTQDLISNAKSIVAYPTPVDSNNLKLDLEEEVDLVKLESVASNLNKLYAHKDLKSLGLTNDNSRSVDIVESYVRMFYSHYIFAKNVSANTKSHPDVAYFALIKKIAFSGSKVNPIDMLQLPNYPTSSNPDSLLYKLYIIIFDITAKANADVKTILQYIMNKMVEQHERHKPFNFAKLKAVSVDDGNEDGPVIMIDDNEDDEETADMFNGFDMDEDDVEDNMDGDID